MKEIFLKTYDNIKIAANHFENGSKNVLIIVHGWFMTKDSKPFFELSKILSKDIDVIAFDCRGHGRSEGKYSFSAQEEKDLLAVYDYAKARYENIFLMGFSLGGALVLLHGAKYNNVSKIIAISPPCSFEKIENKFWHPHAWIPTIRKCELKTWFSVRANPFDLLFKRKPAPINEIESLKTPTLFVCGEKDPTVGMWHTKALFEKASCEKRLEIFENGLHAEDLFLQDREKFVNLCREWIFGQ